MNISPAKIKAFQDKILKFYEDGNRSLPWRQTSDPYKIMVSEIMLQQTQAARVAPKFEAWIKAFPTPQKLAQAKLADVLAHWQGLGYNSRAKRLQDAAKIIVEQFGGKVPRTPEELLTLPGIGPYTSRSVLIFAHNDNLATVDTNIRRILIHDFNIPEDTSDKELFAIAQQLVPKGKSRDYHNALMDYGATIVTARKTGIKPKTQQSTFKGSVRYYRGKILKHLLAHKSITPKQLEKEFTQTPKPINDIAQSLINEGLLVKTRKGYELKE